MGACLVYGMKWVYKDSRLRLCTKGPLFWAAGSTPLPKPPLIMICPIKAPLVLHRALDREPAEPYHLGDSEPGFLITVTRVSVCRARCPRALHFRSVRPHLANGTVCICPVLCDSSFWVCIRYLILKLHAEYMSIILRTLQAPAVAPLSFSIP